ncbi:hypothetical protein HYC85_017233 [Camellia sinensis]|uniref:Amidase domain-containing protein n=1 Tax=Camellia sinensis TaxID=4442 RepID=A0A7J7H379_CAMSI|nr:hypothetical protein HYC85_017233 [Camellia sinensis]
MFYIIRDADLLSVLEPCKVVDGQTMLYSYPAFNLKRSLRSSEDSFARASKGGHATSNAILHFALGALPLDPAVALSRTRQGALPPGPPRADQQLDPCHNQRSGNLEKASVVDLQNSFKQNQLTSRQLVEFYIGEIRRLNLVLRGVIEVNPDALYQADLADQQQKAKVPGSLYGLHGIPILLKDNIATEDKLNTIAGLFALLKSIVPRDAGVVMKLRKAEAIILGKASLSEWANFCSVAAPNGWSAIGGQGKNPYVLSADPCGSSSGSAISVAVNMVAVSWEPRLMDQFFAQQFMDYTGWNRPICRTVTNAVYVLNVTIGFDYCDAQATKEASKYIPRGGYMQFLKVDGLKGKRMRIVRNPFFNFANGSNLSQYYNYNMVTKFVRQRGAVVVDHLEIANIDEILNPTSIVGVYLLIGV